MVLFGCHCSLPTKIKALVENKNGFTAYSFMHQASAATFSVLPLCSFFYSFFFRFSYLCLGMTLYISLLHVHRKRCILHIVKTMHVNSKLVYFSGIINGTTVLTSIVSLIKVYACLSIYSSNYFLVHSQFRMDSSFSCQILVELTFS